MRRNVLICALVLGLTGCSARYAVLTAPAMSMTTPSFEAGRTATAGGAVDAEYCSGDDPIVSHDNNVGLIDEAVMKAQKQSGAVYLADVTVWRDGDCVAVEGTAMK